MKKPLIEITFTATLTMPMEAGIGFSEAVRQVNQALLDGDGGEVPYSLEAKRVKKLALKEGSA